MRYRTLRHWFAALAGVAAVSAGIGVAEIIAAVIAPQASPFVVVGSWIIDLAPGWVKDAVISWFGTADKAVLLISIGILVAALAALSGILELHRPPLGRVLLAAIGITGIVAAVSRANATIFSAVPSATAAIVAIAVAGSLVRRLRSRAELQAVSEAPLQPSADRRQMARRNFLILGTTTTALGVLAAIGGRLLSAMAQAADTARSILTLPKPAVAGPPIPATATLDVPGIAPVISPNADFYRIDTALLVPRLNAAEWKLKVTGLVNKPFTLTFDELAALPLEESTTTLACVSNVVGGYLVGNATWLGYPVRHLIARAEPKAEADMVLSSSVDGFTASTPLTALTDDRNAILAIGMNGEPLPFEHGYPVRMVVPGLYGYVSATKWISELKLTRFDRETAYWTRRGWSARGPIKMSSRIDVPKTASTVHAGTVAIGGVAWAQHTGIARVQVQVDGGEWQDAQLGDEISIDAWRQWAWRWPATRGKHRITVRAIDHQGAIQSAVEADPVPNGASGLHGIEVTVD